ncbi:MAG: CRISPR-associated protein Cas4 [Coleofasciculaceae cyanobacterium RL_1_1]|nr:CRISPR-associated protein Cas4 [Coleofasciculaceae cyanobacterium RL_1_1]
MTTEMIEIPIAALNQYAYCPHRCWRMFCAGEFVENEYTIEGTSLHDRVHTVGDGHRGEIWQVRAIWLRSDQYGLVGKSDLIESSQGEFYPVEYKRGRRGEFENDALQVCAQALCLEEMTNSTIDTGYLYYAHSHQRQTVELTPVLRERTIATIVAVRELFESGVMPPAVYTSRCKGCSLYDRCLPLATKRLQTYREA